MDRKALEGLAASIKVDGLLHNLVVRPVKGKGRRYRIVSGARRYHALKLLSERGELADDFAVPVEIRTGLSKDDTLRIATVENLQRENLTPLEEAAALTKLIHKSIALEDIAAQTGLSPATIKRRLALNGLCEEASEALANGAITLSQAEALTLGCPEAQRNVLEEIGCGYGDFCAEDIRNTLIDDRPTLRWRFSRWSSTPARSPPTCSQKAKPATSTTRSSFSRCKGKPSRSLPVTMPKTPHG